ncbi:GNAT family N-acetyltransferase [Saccharothrix texasensis]|uniref:Acetyltransferase (GNAT) family protein n=1 Tax=Saccharothrix texasensis TaxID=103734 RepID=A0A3N1GZ38_9PSEU|nr:GNAT family N-acetyltransferase [Saccharothrix texasensis]ROP35222.1 acetyltransferase (GNAT) family protein [Saccharothrix texasensis]
MSASLRLAVRNAAALTTGLAHTRGHALTSRDGFLAMSGPTLLRVLVVRPDPDPADVAELALLVKRAEARVVVEDSFGAIDGTALGLTARHLPVMIRPPSPAPPPALRVEPVRTAAEWAVAERVVVDGFPLPGFPTGAALPLALKDREGFRVRTAWRDGVVAGACLTVETGDVAGLYWVATLPEHRSRGVGRALLNAAVGEFPALPMTLSATEQGLPLYESLGFSTVTHATWWSNPA